MNAYPAPLHHERLEECRSLRRQILAGLGTDDFQHPDLYGEVSGRLGCCRTYIGADIRSGDRIYVLAVRRLSGRYRWG